MMETSSGIKKKSLLKFFKSLGEREGLVSEGLTFSLIPSRRESLIRQASALCAVMNEIKAG